MEKAETRTGRESWEERLAEEGRSVSQLVGEALRSLEAEEREEQEQGEQEVRSLIQEAHRDEAVPPPFETLWNRVRAEATTWHRPPLNLRPVFVGALLAVLVALALLWGLREPAPTFAPSAPGPLLADAAWDRTWAGWEGPLDFLLDTPGRPYLESVPTLSTDDFITLERSATDAL